MREIKFRALLRNKNEQWWVYYQPNEVGYADDGSWDAVVAKDLEFTGLYDKNGKEIYEGDILTTGKYSAFVRWERLLGRWETSARPDERIAHASLTEPVARKSEVIGNIYENPSLLKENEQQA